MSKRTKWLFRIEDSVDYDVVWNSIHEDLPKLKLVLISMLKKFDNIN